jgi:hypothetical protein
MKRALSLAILMALIMGLFVVSAPKAATDSTKFVTDYARLGYHADEMILDALKHQGPASKLLREVNYTIPITIPFARTVFPTDSVITTVLAVPTGCAYLIDSMWISCYTEGDVDSSPGAFTATVWVYDASAAGYDSLVVNQVCDAESVVSNTTALLLTKHATSTTSGSLSAGDRVLVRMLWTGPWAVVPKGYAITFKGYKYE